MGQRSQIYVKIDLGDTPVLYARYYQWNYGASFLRRAESFISYVSQESKFWSVFSARASISKELIPRILDASSGGKHIDISHDIIQDVMEAVIDQETATDMEVTEIQFDNALFWLQDNDDGYLFIHITEKGVKYCFVLACDSDRSGKMIGTPITAGEYAKEYKVKSCTTKYVKSIEQSATLMTSYELDDFIYGTNWREVCSKPYIHSSSLLDLAAMWGKASGSSTYELKGGLIRKWIERFNANRDILLKKWQPQFIALVSASIHGDSEVAKWESFVTIFKDYITSLNKVNFRDDVIITDVELPTKEARYMSFDLAAMDMNDVINCVIMHGSNEYIKEFMHKLNTKNCKCSVKVFCDPSDETDTLTPQFCITPIVTPMGDEGYPMHIDMTQIEAYQFLYEANHFVHEKYDRWIIGFFKEI